MDKKFVMGIAAMAALTLVSCSSDDLNSLSDNSSKNEAISFDGYLGRSAVAVNGTRGSVLDKDALQKLTETDGAFGVFGNYSKEGATDGYGENLFKNQKVFYSDSKWTYSPYKYWLPNGHIDFLAYAPYDAKTALTDSKSKISFTVDKEIAKQKDLLWANAADQKQTNNPVKFTFNHALSRLGYTVKLKEKCSDDVTITLKSIKLAGASDDETKGAFYETGTIDLAKANNNPNLWSNCAGQQKFDWFSGDCKVNSSTASHPDVNREKDKDYLFVIPQDFSEAGTNNLYVIVKYEIKYNGISEVFTNTVYKQIIQKFEQGKAYTINLTIGRPIDFDVDVVEGWENGTTIPEIPMD